MGDMSELGDYDFSYSCVSEVYNGSVDATLLKSDLISRSIYINFSSTVYLPESGIVSSDYVHLARRES